MRKSQHSKNESCKGTVENLLNTKGPKFFYECTKTQSGANIVKSILQYQIIPIPKMFCIYYHKGSKKTMVIATGWTQ
jgi:hypothetical protein